ncbi:MAG: tetratricopeptide repeat protein [Saprospiraceae bacterium]|nr:tetratricopeptide repeat protein [Pyrinomonadaceae bacterium]
MLLKWLSILAICILAIPLASFVYPQKTQIDKRAIARYQKSIESGNIEEVERPILDLAVANPANPEVLELLATVRYRQNRVSEASALYRRILTLDPNFSSAKINLARILHNAGQFENSQRMLADVDADSIPSDNLKLNLAAIYLLTGDPRKALETLEKLPLETKNSDALPIIAASYLELKNVKGFRDLIPLMKKASSDPDLAARCAEILQSAGMNGDAVNLLRATLTKVPINYDLLIILGRFETIAKDYASAKAHLDRAAKINPSSAELYFAQALLEEAQGNSYRSLDLLKQARSLAPDSPRILTQFVITAMDANQYRAAVEAAQVLVDAKPDEPEYLYLLGASSLHNGNIAQAELNLQKMVELRPKDSRGCLALGLTFAAQKDKLEKARQQLFHCIEIDPKNIEARYHLGLSYKSQGETGQATKFLVETINLAPDYADALRDLGAVYLQSGSDQKARVVLEKAVALAPNDADIHFQLSRLYNLIGESSLAKTHLEIFQKLRNTAVK